MPLLLTIALPWWRCKATRYPGTADIYPPLMSLRVMLSVEEIMAVFISMTLSAAYGSATATAVLYKLATMVAIIIRKRT